VQPYYVNSYDNGTASSYTWGYECEAANTTSLGDSYQSIKYIKPMIYDMRRKILATINYKANGYMLTPSIKYEKWDKDGWYNWSDASCTSATYGWDDAAEVWTCEEKWYSHAPPVPVDPAARLREMIQQRQGPAIIVPNRRKIVQPTTQMNELRARATLRRVIGDDQYRRFIKNGFITVRALSGKIYQIFPGHGMTTVWQYGKAIEKLCVVLPGDFPPTDSMIMRYLMILNDEDDFRARANVFNAPNNSVTPARTNPDHTTPLPELYRKLRAA